MNEVGIVLGRRGGTVVITRRHKNIARNVEISFPLAKPLSCHLNLYSTGSMFEKIRSSIIEKIKRIH